MDMSRNLGIFLVVLVILLIGVLAFMVGQRTSPASSKVTPTPTKSLMMEPTEKVMPTEKITPAVTTIQKEVTSTPSPTKEATPTP